MEGTALQTGTEGKTWGGGEKSPMKASYGKLMMWFFLTSDALTFSGFLVAYGFSRFKFADVWPIADNVFNAFPGLHGVDAPMYYVALMTFILIFSSVTMVLAVDAGHRLEKGKVATYMLLTILGGAIFLGSQAWEWSHFIEGTHGAVETRGGQIVQFVNADGERMALSDLVESGSSERVQYERNDAFWFSSDSKEIPKYTIQEVKNGFEANPDLMLRMPNNAAEGEKEILSRKASMDFLMNNGEQVVQGANLTHNEYGPPLFADFFFFITGFHGFHVFTGVMINVIIFFNVLIGTYEKRKSYEMVEKVGLYWHFVDLVWVFVFTFFYLV
jgi:cytochrome c oxidase subunit 3